MRLKAEIWVKAYIRRCATAEISAILVRRGDSDAGAIYIKLATLDGRARVFGPAPPDFESGSNERKWVACHGGDDTSDADADDYLARQLEFDPDIWIVEVEDREGRHGLDDWIRT